MSKRKPSGLWWKSLVSGIVLAFLAVVVGFLTAIKEKPEGRLYVSFNTGQEVTFELKEGVTMWLEETNRGLGSSPGRIENAEETVRLYGPDGQQIPFSDDQLGDGGYSEGTFVAPGPGEYKLVADSVGQAESRGRLRGRRPYSVCRTICDVCFFYVLPFGLGLVLLGIIFGVVRLIGRSTGSGPGEEAREESAP